MMNKLESINIHKYVTNDRKTLKFLMQDTLDNQKSLKNQITVPNHNTLKSNLESFKGKR